MQLAGLLVLLVLGSMLFEDPGMIGWVFVGVLLIELASSTSYLRVWKHRSQMRSSRSESFPSPAFIVDGRRHHTYSAAAHGSAPRHWPVSPLRLRDARFSLPGEHRPTTRRPA